jgi:hypothetical protein
MAIGSPKVCLVPKADLTVAFVQAALREKPTGQGPPQIGYR